MNKLVLVGTAAVGLLCGGGSLAAAQDATAKRTAPPAAQPLVGGALPGGAIISAAVVALSPVAGGETVSVPVAGDGNFSARGLKPGRYRLAVRSTTVPKQTQGATFGEKVNSGLSATGSAVAQGASVAAVKHDTAKNSIGNVRQATPTTSPQAAESSAPQSARTDPNAGMPNRISMNVTVAKQSYTVDVDGAGTEIVVGAEGVLAGRVTPK